MEERGGAAGADNVQVPAIEGQVFLHQAFNFNHSLHVLLTVGAAGGAQEAIGRHRGRL